MSRRRRSGGDELAGHDVDRLDHIGVERIAAGGLEIEAATAGLDDLDGLGLGRHLAGVVDDVGLDALAALGAVGLEEGVDHVVAEAVAEARARGVEDEVVVDAVVHGLGRVVHGHGVSLVRCCQDPAHVC